MEIFLQPSDERLELIEWLVVMINPWYDQDPCYRHCYDQDPLQHQLKRLCISLWQLGAMPYSKHTKNLDYPRYVQGLLGRDSSVKLILNLTQLGEAKFSPSLPP